MKRRKFIGLFFGFCVCVCFVSFTWGFWGQFWGLWGRLLRFREGRFRRFHVRWVAEDTRVRWGDRWIPFLCGRTCSSSVKYSLVLDCRIALRIFLWESARTSLGLACFQPFYRRRSDKLESSLKSNMRDFVTFAFCLNCHFRKRWWIGFYQQRNSEQSN